MKLQRARRISQAVFLLLFLFLLWGTEIQQGGVRFSLPVRIFLEADPLNAALNLLATDSLYRGLLWALVILVPTFFLGRFFCGWICPLGTLSHAAGSIHSKLRPGRKRVESNRYKPWQRLKYYILVAGLMAAVFGSAILGLLDPISLSARSFVLGVFPALNYALAPAVKMNLFAAHQPHFRHALLFAGILLGILIANLWVTRFWCRALCPLGALLGLASRWSLLRMEKDPARCGDCNRCLLHCQGGDDPIATAPWRRVECHLCMNCTAECPEGGITFHIGAATKETERGPNLKRRALVTGAVAGAALVPLSRAGAASSENRERLIRPPGALDEPDFLARCIRCSECMRACPGNAIQPALTEAGAEGIWSPVIVPRVGYCQPSCVLCGEACPTGAIWTFTPEQKGWRGAAKASVNPIRIGTAFYDRGRCLPWAMATECIVCEEWCPTSPKAVYLRDAEVPASDGSLKKVRQPYISAAQCVGCGACEYACPVKGRPAVYVTSVGESRSRTNRMILQRGPGAPHASALALPDSGDAPGWERTAAVRTYSAANLWERLDGGAEKYVQAGIVTLMTAPYRWQSSLEAALDLHAFKDASGAKAVFDSEPAVGSKLADVGETARLYRGSLTFRRGPYLVRMVAYGDSDKAAAALLDLARAADKRLPQR